MLNTGKTFTLSVFTLYALYREITNQAAIFELSLLVRLLWTTSYVAGVLLVIYMASALASEVSIDNLFPIFFADK